MPKTKRRDDKASVYRRAWKMRQLVPGERVWASYIANGQETYEGESGPEAAHRYLDAREHEAHE